jgi:hypothetical protein
MHALASAQHASVESAEAIWNQSTSVSPDCVVGPERATSLSAVEPSREVGPTSRRRLARHNI